jgi:rifampicin phosphotransferase
VDTATSSPATPPDNIVFVGDQRAGDRAKVGGKGASLFTLAALDCLVPDFFVITTDAYLRLASSGPASLADEVRGGLERIGALTEPVAVRSSAVDEDSAERSFAGLFATVLNVVGVDDVVTAVATCWASADGAHVAAYRAAGSIPRDGAMAVIVQRMVAAEWAGVSFGVNPVTQHLGEIVIEATPGLGEALMSGEVDPEQVVVAAEDGTVTSRRHGDAGGRLPDQVVAQVWRITAELGQVLRFPQDVEWAFADSAVHVLQSRPVTTVGDVFYSRFIEPWCDDPAARPDDPARLWSRAYADEIWSPPVSPLFYNVQNLTGSFVGYMRWHHDETSLPPDVFKYHQACAYVDVEVLRRQYAYHPRFSRIAGILNFFPADVQPTVNEDPWLWRGRLRRTAHFELQERSLRSLRHNHETLESLWPDLVATTDDWFDLDLDGMTVDELRAHQAAVGATMMTAGPACGFAVAYHAHDLTFILTGLLERWFGEGDQLYARVTSGLADSDTVREAQQLWTLASMLRGDPALARAVETFATLERECRASARGRRFLVDLEDFWRNHRHRGATYKDLVYPRWGDDKDLLLSAVHGYLRSSGPEPLILNAEAAARRRQTQDELLAACRGPRAHRRAILRWLFRYNEIYMRERDNHRYYFDRVWYQLRRIYSSYGQRLADAGVLAGADDVFYLGTGEIESAMAYELAADEARQRVAARRRTWERTRLAQAPKFLRGYTALEERHPGDSATVLRGLGASPGTATGRARVVHDVSELATLTDGDVLVTRQTDPSWSTAFARITALVLETGGALAHGASLCREYDLPCVTSIEAARTRIPDGARVRVDGRDGTVELLAEPSPTSDGDTSLSGATQ